MSAPQGDLSVPGDWRSQIRAGVTPRVAWKPTHRILLGKPTREGPPDGSRATRAVWQSLHVPVASEHAAERTLSSPRQVAAGGSQARTGGGRNAAKASRSAPGSSAESRNRRCSADTNPSARAWSRNATSGR